jgi:hypothetical protein
VLGVEAEVDAQVAGRVGGDRATELRVTQRIGVRRAAVLVPADVVGLVRVLDARAAPRVDVVDREVRGVGGRTGERGRCCDEQREDGEQGRGEREAASKDEKPF